MKKIHKIGFVTMLIVIAFFALSISKSDGLKESLNQTQVIEIEPDSIPIIPSMFPAILVKNQENDSSIPLSLNDLKINIEVIGNIATTTFEMTFYNDLDRVLEGQLYFPLGEGKTVSRFAMDVNGRLREGVIVEKAKGRQVFESIVRKNVDPGLLEWTKGNNFKARVYPIPAKGYKKIIIAYEQSLFSYPTQNIYVLPLGIEQKVKNFDLKVEVFKQNIKPDLGENELTNFSFTQMKENYVAESHFTNYTPNQQLVFALPLGENPKTVYTQTEGNQSYFYLTVNPKIYKKGKVLPTKIGLLWDVSNSATNRQLKKENKLLDLYFKQFDNLKVELVTFSNQIHITKSFTINNGDWSELKQFLKGLDYDGGTQLGAIDLTKIKGDAFLLFTDGISNFGKSTIKTSDKAIYTITTNQVSDFSYLKYLALTSGGQFINGTELVAADMVSKLSNSPYRFIGATYATKEISETYPKTEVLTSKGFQLAGKLNENETTIKLNFGFGNEITHTEKVELKIDRENQSNLIKRIWAQNKLADLDVFYKKNETQIISLAKEHGLVTRFTSLIILDTYEDYLTHKIIPPAEWKEKYLNQIAENKKQEQKEEESHLKMVKDLFASRVTWWNTDFEKQIKAFKGKKGDMASDNTTVSNRPPPPAPILMDSDGNVEFEQITESESDEELLNSNFTTVSGNENRLISADNLAPLPNRSENQMASTVGGMLDIAKVVEEKEKLKKGNIALKEWNPKAPYIDKLKTKSQKELWATYLSLKKEYTKTPAFFLDVSTYFSKELDKETALRVLSNLAELELENHQVLRILAYRLIELKQYDLAIDILTEVVKMREEEPQSFRDLGLAYSLNNNPQKAIETLYKVIETKWDDRFPGIELIVLNEMNAVIGKNVGKVNTDFIDKSLIKNLPVDVRVVLNWDTDNCDMDLWVTDPLGEKCFYSHNKTVAGGIMTNDFTRGYGPEVFLIKKAIKGKYKIEANYYGTSSQKLLGPVTIKLNFFTQYGTKNQEVKEVTLRLTKGKEVVEIAEIEF